MLVIKMDMPKNCKDCNLQDECGWCQVCGKSEIVDYESNERPSKCPIVCDTEQIKESIHDILFELSDGGTYLDVERQKVEDKIFEIIDKEEEDTQ